MLILAIIVFGILAGGLAQMILGSSMDEVNWPLAFASGLIGSFIGGLLVSLLAGDGIALRASGLIGSIAGAIIFTLGWQALARKRGA